MERFKNNIQKIYLYYFFRSFILAYVIERLFWASRGMSITDTVYTEFVYAFAMIFLEIPSGLWADRYGRKNVILLGSAFNVMTLFMMLHIYGLTLFSIAIALSAVNGALTSGSVNALVYDSLAACGEKNRFEKVLARIKVTRYASGLLAAFIGAYSANRMGLLFNYQVSFVSTILAFLVMLSIKEPPRSADDSEMTEETQTLSVPALIRMSVITLKKDAFLRRIMFLAGAMGGAIVFIEEFWQNFFDLLQVDVLYFGLFSGAMSVSVILASHYSPIINGFFRDHTFLSHKRFPILMLAMLSTLLVIGLMPSVFSLLLMCIAVGIAAINETMVHTDLHHRVSSANRATIESVYSMVERLLVICLGLIFGWVSDWTNVFGGFTALGIALFGILVITSLFKRDSGRPSV